MTDIVMPRLSDSMQEGTILTWLIDDGEPVKEGQELVEIETDKATMTHESEHSGVLSIVVPAGTTVAVGEVIGRVGAAAEAAQEPAGEQVPADEQAAGGEPAANVEPAADVQRAADVEPAPGPAPPEPAPVAVGAPSTNCNGGGETVPATPMARRMARVHGVALEELRGSGPRGRIVRADVMQAAGLDGPTPSRQSAPVVPSSDGDHDGVERVELTRLQALVARRMAEAKTTIPEFQVQTEVEMTAAIAFRNELKALTAAGDDAAPSLNDLIVKACALCLRAHPRANGSYVDGGFALHPRVNVGIAVAADDALVVPVVHDADERSLGQITDETRRLAAAVRAGTVTPPELSGATFTVSNLGMYGMTAITPVINPPQAAILGVGAIRDVLARRDSEIVDLQMLTLTLSCDHRILYGADASGFLAAIRRLLQAPAGLAL